MKTLKRVVVLIFSIACLIAVSGFSSMACSNAESTSSQEYFNTSIHDKSSSSYTISNDEDVKEGDIVWMNTVIIMPEHVSPDSELSSWVHYVGINYMYNKDLRIAFYDNKEDAQSNNLSNAKEIWKDKHFTEEYSEKKYYRLISLSFDTEKINENNWPYMVISFSTTYSEAPTKQLEQELQRASLEIRIIMVICACVFIFFLVYPLFHKSNK